MICWPTAQLAVAERKYNLLHADEPYHDGTFTIFTDKPTKMTPFHVLDGLTIYLSEVDDNPDDDFTTNRYAKLPSVAAFADQGSSELPEAD